MDRAHFSSLEQDGNSSSMTTWSTGWNFPWIVNGMTWHKLAWYQTPNPVQYKICKIKCKSDSSGNQSFFFIVENTLKGRTRLQWTKKWSTWMLYESSCEIKADLCFLPLCRIWSNKVKSDREDPSALWREASHLLKQKKRWLWRRRLKHGNLQNDL